MPKFILGLKLSKLFYWECVKPILDEHFPRLAYSAGLIGYGSDVIGFDTIQSTDHMWGPRLYLFIPDKNYQSVQKNISTTLGQELPYTFKGYSVNFNRPNPNDNGVQWLEPIVSGPVNHLVKIYTLKSFFKEYLNCNPFANITIPSWLTFTEHRLLAVTSGGVFHDDLGLETIRQKFSYFPDDIWLYLLAAQWTKIGQEEAFVGRCGDVGDEIGSQIIAARIVQSLMRLCFLMEKKYIPYSKWFGSGFARLYAAKELKPILNNILLAETWQKREHHLSKAYTLVATKHNGLRITKPISTDITSYHGRPYQVIFADRFVEEIRKVLTDKTIKRVEANIGSVNQFSDSVDVYNNLNVCARLKMLYLPKGSDSLATG